MEQVPNSSAADSRKASIPGVDGPVRVLFLCTANSCRSQMAEGLLRREGLSTVAVFSAGTKPTTVHADAIRVMAEIGVDISTQQSKPMGQYLGDFFDYVITLCGDAHETCPAFPGTPLRLHWPLPDPTAAAPESSPVSEAERLQAFREVRDELGHRVEDLLSEILDGFLRELHQAYLARSA